MLAEGDFPPDLEASDVPFSAETADAPLTIALRAIPADDWRRTWAACRTIMLTMTSKGVKQVVQNMRLPVVIHRATACARHKMWHTRQLVFLRQLEVMADMWRIVTLSLPYLSSDRCDETGRALAQILCAAVLQQCPALVQLNLHGNHIGDGGAERLAGVLGQCTTLLHLNLSQNNLGAAVGPQGLAGLLTQCTALAHLDLSENFGVLPLCTSLAHLNHLNLAHCVISDAGTERLAGVLPQCQC